MTRLKKILTGVLGLKQNKKPLQSSQKKQEYPKSWYELGFLGFPPDRLMKGE